MSFEKVCIILSSENYPSSHSLVSILEEILGYNRIIILRHKGWTVSRSFILKLLIVLLQDAMIFLRIIRTCKKENISAILIFQGYYPILTIGSQLLNIKCVLFSGGSNYPGSYLEATSTIAKVFSYANLPMQRICHRFLDVLITPSENIMKEISFEAYKDKARFGLARIDKDFYDKFRIIKTYEDRSDIVGYVGLLSRKKGILNFIQAVPLVIKRKSDCKFMVIGRGPLLETIKVMLQNLGLSRSVTLTGFVDCIFLARYYNEMKLLVLPSYTEGLPSVMLEAMACGTPVLASPVGGIPDIIKEGETGFLLESNDPKYIADKIVELLNKPELLEKVGRNTYKWVRKNFNYKKTLKAWQNIFEQLQNNN